MNVMWPNEVYMVDVSALVLVFWLKISWLKVIYESHIVLIIGR
jgi:hypothetical protein